MTMPKSAMLLAAGRGTRMRPLTDRTAKSLLPLAGSTLIDHALDRLADAGVEQVVVNTHWHADLLGAHLRGRSGPPATVLRHETALLDTGGAVQAALAGGRLGDGSFFVVNGDTFWLDGPRSALQRMEDVFDPDRLDGLLLVHRAFQVMGETGLGDFMLDKWGLVRRRAEREVVPYVFAGVQLLSPALFSETAPGVLAMDVLWDRAIEAGRLAALVHDGLWFKLSTPADLVEAETSLRERAVGETR
jgi:N-acetyl-alpha-D-muramate 1-phosphate uridylyltransferase